MKKKELTSLRSKTVEELEKLISEKGFEILKTRANLTASKEKNLKKIKNLRRDQAQISTVSRELMIMEKVAGKGKGEE